MSQSSAEIWGIIIALGIGTYLIRFSFLGLIGNRQMPDWVLRHLRYTPVAIIPGLVAPLALWPSSTGGEPEPVRLAAAVITVAIGWWTKNVILALVAGGATLSIGLWLT